MKRNIIFGICKSTANFNNVLVFPKYKDGASRVACNNINAFFVQTVWCGDFN